jgi:MYXO-CTERM domain-containing protein
MDALRRVRSELPGAAFVPSNDDERALIDDAPFDLDSDMHDLGAVTMVLGNRDVDLLGNEPDDLDELAPIHGDPNRQDEHCLRTDSDDEPDGSAIALERCRANIDARVRAAFAGLDANDVPDPAKRTEIEVFLELRGSVDAPLPTYQVEIGRALHPLQDGFSHVYRNPADQRQVTVVLNFIDLAEERLDERVDGPPHNSELDRCVDLDAFRAERFELAIQASYELIKVTLDPDADRASKQANTTEVLERYLTLDTTRACNVDNNWCDAPEQQYAAERGCVCSHAGTGAAPPAAFAALSLLVGGYFARRARRRRARAVLATGAPLLLALAAPTPAAAADALPPADPQQPTEARAFEGGPVIDTTPDAPQQRRDPFRFGAVLAAGGALQNGALAGSLGAVFRLNGNLLFGLDAEYNPWFSIRNFDLKRGSTNFYGSVILRFPLSFQRVNLRSTLQLGVSRMNFALFGVPEGSVGPYVGFNLLGVDYELARGIYLIVNPAHIAIPIPKLSGTPFYYPQYRFTLGVQFGG